MPGFERIAGSIDSAKQSWDVTYQKVPWKSWKCRWKYEDGSTRMGVCRQKYAAQVQQSASDKNWVVDSCGQTRWLRTY